jgi:uncharacterized protein (DUF488 family)
MKSEANFLLSIGHSNHQVEKFIHLLIDNDIEGIADIRSVPSSNYSPQFNEIPLQRELKKHSINYAFFGDSLGGRPKDVDCYDDEGHVFYDRVAVKDFFSQGLDELLELSKNCKTAMMCSEGSPNHCHRHLLVSRILLERGIDVAHILPDGLVVDASDILGEQKPQPTLFGEEEMSWRSIQSVSPNIQRQTFSDY